MSPPERAKVAPRTQPEASDPVLLDRCARELAQSGPTGAETLLMSLDSREPDRIAAALDYLPFSAADRTLVTERANVFLTHPDAQVRASAIDALRHLENTGPAEQCTGLLDDPDWQVQNAALSYLVWHDPETGITEAVRRLKDDQPRIREHAMDLIHEYVDDSATDDLWDVILPLIGDRDPLIRAAARSFLLRRMPEESFQIDSQVDWLRAVNAAHHVATNGPEALQLYATDPAALVRLNLVESLTAWANREQSAVALAAHPDFIRALRSDPDSAVREAAFDLGQE